MDDAATDRTAAATQSPAPAARRPPTGPAWALCLAVCLGLSGCATPPSREARDAQDDTWSLQSYRSVGAVDAHPGQGVDQAWRLDGHHVTLTRTASSTAQSLPLVIYLPALGEDSRAGQRWRSTWAAAGYAVLSVQPLEEDVTAWSSELALAGDFKSLGRQRFAGAAAAQRVQWLGRLVAEVRRRAQAGEPPWQQVDWRRVAVAGFDLGASTAQIVAGEHVAGAEDAASQLAVQAIIVLSPYAPDALRDVDSRYQDITLPVLWLTSDLDVDPIGLVGDPAQRRLPFEHGSGTHQYLLTVHGLPRVWLSGTTDDKALHPGSGRDRSAARAGAGSDDAPSGSKRGGKRRGPADNAVATAPFGASDEDDLGPRLSSQALQQRVLAVQSVSTAFLDAHLRGSVPAQRWLGEDAGRWVAPVGDFAARP